MSAPDARVVELRPDHLGPRALALWDGMAAAGQPAWRAVLLGEACRLTDRLDDFDALLNADSYAWARLSFDDVDEVYDLRIDSAAAEARQTASTLRLILAQLTPVSQHRGAAAPGEGPATSAGGGTLADEIARRRVGRATGT